MSGLRKQICLPLTHQNAAGAARLYTEVFTADEPTTRHADLDSSRFLPFAVHYVRTLVDMDLSYLTGDGETEEPAGFIFCLDLTDDPEQGGPEMIAFLSHFREAIAMINELEDRYFDREAIQSGSVLHIFQIGVKREFRGTGIAQQMIHQVIKQARNRGFTRIVADCTSITSKRVFERCGFLEAGYYPYQDFQLNGVRHFEGLDHGIYLMVKELGT
ncbi:MAG: GNAT family N-acetyltransferase [Methanospirillum sp.]|uniref:GNAT family N-acetyltransferase n=1 Tax=Methanospirillum sp. TaxID=45200 RepID=UPI002371781E|nr:GNAT family N-acetyltransferase [Methanospirillum sp.]MDD1727633.1 GNAT family N-acetyltransferase [Methanospirillum sp.]